MVRISVHFNSVDKSFINIEHDRDRTHPCLRLQSTSNQSDFKLLTPNTVIVIDKLIIRISGPQTFSFVGLYQSSTVVSK